MMRIKNIQKYLRKQDCDALIIDEPIDLFYLTDIELSLGRLLILHNKAVLFVDGRYFEACRKKTSLPVVLTSGYGKNSAFAATLEKILPKGKILSFDGITESYQNFTDLKKLARGCWSLKALIDPVKKARAIKDADEIEALRKAAKLGAKGFDHVLTLLKEGITERKVAHQLEIFWLEKGGEKCAFPPIIAFGENTSQPHYRSGERRLKQGDIVLIDIGVVLKKYNSDMTRTLFFGDPDPKLLEIYSVVREAQALALERCVPGTKIKDVDGAARDFIAKKGFGNYFPHGLGHGVGLEIHELPLVKRLISYEEEILAPGMVITIEPGIYLPGLGGVRLEDTIVINEKGYENLTLRPVPSEGVFKLLSI